MIHSGITEGFVFVIGCLVVIAVVRLRTKKPGEEILRLVLVEQDFCGHGLDKKQIKERLSQLDEAVKSHESAIVVAYRFETILDHEKVKKGFQSAVRVFPAFASSMDVRNGRLVFDKGPGACFKYLEGFCLDGNDLPDLNDSWQKWELNGIFVERRSGDPSSSDPLTIAKLVVVPDFGVSYLSLSVNHSICDAQNYCEFLKIWSDCCCEDGSMKRSMLAPIGQRVVVTRDVKGPRNRKELEQFWMENIKSGPCPINNSQAWEPVMQYEPNPAMIPVEFIVSRKGIQKWKQRLSTQKEWVSSFETLMGILIFLHNNVAETAFSMCHVCCNVRGRSSRYAANYFGNAVFELSFEMNTGSSTSVLSELKHIVRTNLHENIRGQLKNEWDLIKKKEWLLAARSLGVDTFRKWNPFYDIVRGTGPFVNSWTRYNFLDNIRFGSKCSPRCVKALPLWTYYPYMWFETPCTKETSNVVVKIEQSKIGEWKALISKHDFPLTFVT